METPKKDWYDNKGLVIFLLVIFFPVGLYALWKNNSFSKGLKIGLTTVVALFVIIVGTSDEKKQAVQKEVPIQKKDKEVNESMDAAAHAPKTITEQELFVTTKVNMYKNEYVNAQNNAQKSLFFDKTKKFTKSFLDSLGYAISDWKGEIKMIQLGHKPSDMKLLKQGMTPNQVKEKDPANRPININIVISNMKVGDASYYATVHQSQDKNLKGGIYPSNPIYEDVLKLNEGQKVQFSAVVKDVQEYKSDNKSAPIEQLTHFKIELTAIRAIN